MLGQGEDESAPHAAGPSQAGQKRTAAAFADAGEGPSDGPRRGRSNDARRPSPAPSNGNQDSAEGNAPRAKRARSEADNNRADYEARFLGYLESLVEDSMSFFPDLNFTDKQWLEMFLYARELMIRNTERSKRLLVISLCNADTQDLGVENDWNQKFPWYQAANPEKSILGQIFFYAAERHIRSAEDAGTPEANPLTKLAYNTAADLKATYWDKGKATNYNLGIRVLVAMAGCKRWISNGLSNIELWDIAFSRHMLSKSQVTELLRDDSNFVEQALTKPAVQKLLDDPEFLGIISREAHRFLLEAVCQFRMPLPSLFFDRFESVLNALQVDQPQIAGWSEALKKMLTRALQDKGTPTRGPVLATLFYIVNTVCQAVNTYPCVAPFGKTSAGKSTFLNSQAYAQLPREPAGDTQTMGSISDLLYQQNAETIRNDGLRENAEHLTTNYTTLQSLLRTSGATDSDEDAQTRKRYVEENFETVLDKAIAKHTEDDKKRELGSKILNDWDDWFLSADPSRKVPPFLLPVKPPSGRSTTACVTYLSHGPIFCAGAWYKSRDQILGEGIKLWENAKKFASNATAGNQAEEPNKRVLRLFVANVLGLPDAPTWADLERWMGTGAPLNSTKDFKAQLDAAIDSLPEGQGYKVVDQDDRLSLAVGLGKSVKDDLGHCAHFLREINEAWDPSTGEGNRREAFLDVVFVVAPMRSLGNTGALFIDPPGTADVNILRSDRCQKALREAEVIIHLTAEQGIFQSDQDTRYLQEFWQNFLPTAPAAERKFLWHLGRGTPHDRQAWEKEALDGYRAMAGNDYDVSGIILSTYDLTKVGDKGGTLAKMRKILERAAERGRTSIYSHIANALQRAINFTRSRRDILSIGNLSSAYQRLSDSTFHTKVAKATRDVLGKVKDDLLVKVDQRLSVEALFGATFDAPVKVEAFKQMLRDSTLFVAINTPQQVYGNGFRSLGRNTEEVYREIVEAVSHHEPSEDEHRKRFVDQIKEDVYQRLGTGTHTDVERERIAELFQGKALQFFAPTFDKISVSFKDTQVVPQLRRKLENLLERVPFPKNIETEVTKFLKEFSSQVKALISKAFEPVKQELLRRELQALFDEDRVNESSIDGAQDLWSEVLQLANELLNAIRERNTQAIASTSTSSQQ